MEGVLNSGAKMPEGEVTMAEFVPLELQHKKLSMTQSRYRVYRDAENYEEVEAESAYEALRKAEVEKPFKISRFNLKDLSLLSGEMIVDDQTVAPQEDEQKAD